MACTAQVLATYSTLPGLAIEGQTMKGLDYDLRFGSMMVGASTVTGKT